MQDLTYSYSRLSSPSVGRLVDLHYDLPETADCKFHALGLHDNYLVECANRKYILRVYRNDWRKQEEINFELELLTYLGERTALVAALVYTKTGNPCFSVDSPEGKRTIALFNYAAGEAPENNITVTESELLGGAVANIHALSESFSASYARPVLDLSYLVDESILAIKPFLDQQAWRYMAGLQKILYNKIPLLASEPGVYGICIGDVNPGNFHVNDNNKITLFDFDQCGYGYKVFDIAKYISSLHSVNDSKRIATAFLDGYQNIRQLSQAETDAIPYYEIISVIWVMAIHAYNAERIGHKWLGRPFWDKRLAILKALEVNGSE